jgi:hypothetical protein
MRCRVPLLTLLAAFAFVAQGRGEEPKQPAAAPKPRVVLNDVFAGNRTSTSVFGVAGEGSRFVYVFDRSGSMDDPGGTPLKAAKKELMESLSQLTDIHQFYIIFYNEAPRAFEAPTGRGKLTFANENNKNSAQAFVDGIRAEGGTNHFDALLLAVKLRPDVIFLLTDGEEKDGLSGEQLERLRKLNDGVAAIQVVQFTHGPRGPDASLAKLARDNRGQHRVIDITRPDALKPRD